MKSLWLILLVIAVVLVVTAESRKDRKPGKKAGVGKGKGGRNNKPNKKECPVNCSNCGLAGRCVECDDGFVKITLPKKRSKEICVPCSQQLSNKRKGLDRDTSKCPTEPTTSAKPTCPTDCSSCQDGICLVCDSGFALVSRRKNNTICIPCGSGRNGKKVDKSQCGSDTCGKGCLKCTNGSCSACKDGFELNQEKSKCKKKKDCARGCLNCTSGICSKCKEGLTLNRKSKKCVKLCSAADPDVKTRPGCEGRPKGKEGKKKRKGGKRKSNRKPTSYPEQPQ
ncbi:major surface trophozoite antigen 11-like [Orbicella faveolata]|uniref:major surface trophozoite antigen 11-like n=1 Tax=Orbicella faveolata TaxID=48498 RepID=UPI0009E48D14|nr:major surface trophozoite antigen 11-like [Orbicella faveolata]